MTHGLVNVLYGTAGIRTSTYSAELQNHNGPGPGNEAIGDIIAKRQGNGDLEIEGERETVGEKVRER